MPDGARQGGPSERPRGQERLADVVQVLLFMMPLGFTIEEQSASVDVSLDVGGRNDVGHGSARKRGSIYASARRRALAAALDAALADAAVLGAD